MLSRTPKKIKELRQKCGPPLLDYLKQTLHVPEQETKILLQETFAKAESDIDKFHGDDSCIQLFKMAKNLYKVKELYNNYGPLIRRYFKNRLNIPTQDADELLSETFVKVTSSIDDFRGDGSEKNWVFKIAKNTTFNYFKARKELPVLSSDLRKSDDEETKEGDDYWGEAIENPQELFPEDFENRLDAIMTAMEKTLCIQLCMEKALAQYELDYPHVLCPLLVTLSALKCPIEEMADIILRTVPETKKLLAQCRKKMKRYKDLDEYEQKHGQESLCWLIIQLHQLGWTVKEIGEIIGKSEGAVRTARNRCRQKMIPYFKPCKDNC